MSTEIEIPESNRWEDFVWPEWVPARERELIEGFWRESWGRGPRRWAENAVAPYTNGIQTGARARMWSYSATGRILVEGRYVHRWNNMGTIVLDDGTSVGGVSGVATEASIEIHKAHVTDRLARMEWELVQLRAEAAALGVEVGS